MPVALRCTTGERKTKKNKKISQNARQHGLMPCQPCQPCQGQNTKSADNCLNTVGCQQEAKANAACASARHSPQTGACTCRNRPAMENSWYRPATHCSSGLHLRGTACRRQELAGHQTTREAALAQHNRTAHRQDTDKAAN